MEKKNNVKKNMEQVERRVELVEKKENIMNFRPLKYVIFGLFISLGLVFSNVFTSYAAFEDLYEVVGVIDVWATCLFGFAIATILALVGQIAISKRKK